MSEASDRALSALNEAQTLLEKVEADNLRLQEMATFLTEASARADELADYYSGEGQEHIETVLADDPDADTPPVANEDAAWEACASHADALMHILRAVTEGITSGLDEEE